MLLPAEPQFGEGRENLRDKSVVQIFRSSLDPSSASPSGLAVLHEQRDVLDPFRGIYLQLLIGLLWRVAAGGEC